MSFLPSFDRRLVGRVKKYLNENRRVTIDDMADDLQLSYRQDYGRRKRNAFRKLVKQVYQSIKEERARPNLKDLEKQHLSKRRKEDSSNSTSDSDSASEEYIVEFKDKSSMNSSITSLYKKQKKSYSMPSSPYQYVDCSTPMLANIETVIGKEKLTDCKPTTPDNIEKDINGNMLDTEQDRMEMSKQGFQFSDSDFENVEKNNVPSNLASNIKQPETELVKPPRKREKDKLKHRKRKKKKSTENDDIDIDIKGKDARPTFTLQASNIKFEDIGGNEKTLREVCKLLVHIQHPEIYKNLGVIPPCGVLLHGPPGCGKSLLASGIAGELCLPMLKIAATEIVSGVSGESEQKLRDLFEMAVSSAPCIVFIDEIDAITPKRETASKDMERRIVAQLLSCLDELNTSPVQVLVIGATNRPDSIDPALRRAGRFDREICMGIPDEKARQEILRVLCKKLKLESEFNYELLARLSPGYVGADLMSLCREAAMCAVNRILSSLQSLDTTASISTNENDDICEETNLNGDDFENLTVERSLPCVDESAMETSCLSGVVTEELEPTNENTNKINRTEDLSSFELLSWLRKTTPLTDEQLNSLFITFADFENALPFVQPSAKREGFATVPDVTWEDIGALEDIREELAIAILAPVRNPAAFKALGLNKPPGILLAGPPGCGKTLLAKAIANESGINFISVKGPELLNMYVGESERAVRQCFERARSSAPCVIFFDELDSLCPRRSGAESSSTARVVNQMLTEMDGLESRKHVYVMAATNRPDIIDPAVLRPGRLDKTLYIGLPKSEDRVKILQTITRNGTKPPMHEDVCLESIAKDERCNRFTGADLSSLVREAAVNAIKEHISSKHVFENDSNIGGFNVKVGKEHFEKSFSKVKPSVSSKDEMKYIKMKQEFEG